MSNLRSTIDRIAAKFTADVLAALRGASLSDLSMPKGSSASPAPRREPGPRGWSTGGHDMARLVKALRASKDGMRSEDLQKTLGLPKPAVLRAANRAIEMGSARKTGIKRGTRYFAA